MHQQQQQQQQHPGPARGGGGGLGLGEDSRNMEAERECQRLLQNDPFAESITAQSWHRNSFVRLGESLVGNTNCWELSLHGLLLDEETACALAKGIRESKLKRLTICQEISEVYSNTNVPGTWRRVLMDGLRYSTTLRELTLDSVRIDQLDGLFELLKAPSASSSSSSSSPSSKPAIRKLCLAWLVLNEPEPTQQLADALEGHNILECLHIIGHFVSMDNFASETMWNGIQRSRVRELVLEQIPTDQLEIWRSKVTTMPALDTLTLCRFLDLPEAEQYVRFVLNTAAKPTLTTLQLKFGIFDSHALSRLSRVVQHLTTLKLHALQIDDQGLAALLGNWFQNSLIQNISLLCNNIGPESVTHIVSFVHEQPALQSINLSINLRLGYEGLRRIGEELPHLPPRFTRLDLTCCAKATVLKAEDPSNSDKQAAAWIAAGHDASLVLLHGIQHNVNIQTLDVDDNGFPVDVLNSIQFYVGLNKLGRYLMPLVEDNHHDGLPPSIWCHVMAKAQYKYPQYEGSIIYFYLCQRPTLARPARTFRYCKTSR